MKKKRMAAKNKQIIAKEDLCRTQLDSDLFAPGPAGTMGMQPSERDVFAGDEDFYRSLTGSAPPVEEPVEYKIFTDPAPPAEVPVATSAGSKLFSMFQGILLAAILVIAGALLFIIFGLKPEPVLVTSSINIPRQLPAGYFDSYKTSLQQARPAAGQSTGQEQVTKKPAVSLRAANDFYLEGHWRQAYQAYEQLYQSTNSELSGEKIKPLLKDFFCLKMAMCKEKGGEPRHAKNLLDTISESRSPFIRVLANYRLSQFEMQKERYLPARTRAYKALALSETLDFDSKWVKTLQRDCLFCIAESTTKTVLSLRDADKGLPPKLWERVDQLQDPSADLDEEQLHRLLLSGSNKLTKGLLGPQISKAGPQTAQAGYDGLTRWEIICNGAPFEELVARFATRTGLDIQWAVQRSAEADPIVRNVTNRPVTMYLSAATTQQFMNIVTGCAGLLAKPDDNINPRMIKLFDPLNYSSLSEHMSLLAEEAISLWERYLLEFAEDRRIPNTHFALALLHAANGDLAESMAEHKLVANRFLRTHLAPYSLLHSSKLKTGLRDYSGARQDLKQLVEQHYDTQLAGQACVYLADVTMQTGDTAEAQRLYRKAYRLNSEVELQAAAALGAGKCFYELKDYEDAAHWLTRHLDLTADRTSTEACSAYNMLGKAYWQMGKLELACEAFEYAMAGELTNREKLEAISALVKANMQQQHFFKAFELVENLDSAGFSMNEMFRLLVIKSRILRSLGLPEKAIELIGDKPEYATNPQLAAEAYLELSRCYLAKGQLELAHKKLSETLLGLENGPWAQQIALELAQTCLKLGNESEALTVASGLLDSEPADDIRQSALEVMAQAYRKQDDYDSAAQAFLGQYVKGTEKPDAPAQDTGTADKPATPMQ